MPKVTINAPKTPVTKGSKGIAAATVPNVCKMPGPPAPFVPTPLPNIGKSGDSPQGYSSTVTIEGQPVAIRGASFGSMGDVASQGTGGGIVSSNTQGRTKFIGPGSMNVKIEGKNVQLLGDAMLNNCGPNGSPANAATMAGEIQMAGTVTHLIKKTPRATQCPDGRHSDVIEHPHVPPEEVDPLRRLDAMRRAGATENELAAAQHNIAEGIITHGAMLSRGLTPEERVDGKNGEEQKIHAVCSECHRRREIDHASSPTSIAEAKDLKAGWGDATQRANNIKFAKDGGDVTYKITRNKAAGLTGKAIWQAFKEAGAQAHVRIVGV